MDTEGNISDENGNILMSSNGIFIADATGDTMLGGGGLNPGQVVDDFKDNGLPMPYANLFLPMPNDSNKYILFHQVLDYTTNNVPNIYYSIVDISLNGGLGQVISKNNIALSGSFGGGITACKHGNGRDWWVIAVSYDGSLLHEFLLTPNGVNYIGVQNLSLQPTWGWGGQPVFSPDGEKFAFRNGYVSGMSWYMYMNLMHFDRCTGDFVLDTVINYSDSTIGYGTMFSPDSRYLYFSTSEHIYQVDTDAPNIAATFQTVATNDIFLSAPPVFYTNFYLMYLAANGKIYITSTSGVLDLHEMDYPDSAGIACTVNLHNIHLPCFNVGTVPNHPNYYLGRKIGSVCDSLTSLTPSPSPLERGITISPNPNNGNFKIMYLLPQNQKGKLEIFDINGRAVYSQNLPPWSTLQSVSLPKLSNGVYLCSITSNSQRVNKKLVIYHE
ncbi:MAG: T9SS type A sorting domain-containing protein [Bacteroidetes bacterium]|nr:T9SS type A sorting domain-containing protein [Bacteroidota bacterium]